MIDLEYMLALAEEEHMRREAVYRERVRAARAERHRKRCAQIRAEILRLMAAPFSWQ